MRHPHGAALLGGGQGAVLHGEGDVHPGGAHGGRHSGGHGRAGEEGGRQAAAHLHAVGALGQAGEGEEGQGGEGGAGHLGTAGVQQVHREAGEVRRLHVHGAAHVEAGGRAQGQEVEAVGVGLGHGQRAGGGQECGHACAGRGQHAVGGAGQEAAQAECAVRVRLCLLAPALCLGRDGEEALAGAGQGAHVAECTVGHAARAQLQQRLAALLHVHGGGGGLECVLAQQGPQVVGARRQVRRLVRAACVRLAVAPEAGGAREGQEHAGQRRTCLVHHLHAQAAQAPCRKAAVLAQEGKAGGVRLHCVRTAGGEWARAVGAVLARVRGEERGAGAVQHAHLHARHGRPHAPLHILRGLAGEGGRLPALQRRKGQSAGVEGGGREEEALAPRLQAAAALGRQPCGKGEAQAAVRRRLLGRGRQRSAAALLALALGAEEEGHVRRQVHRLRRQEHRRAHLHLRHLRRQGRRFARPCRKVQGRRKAQALRLQEVQAASSQAVARGASGRVQHLLHLLLHLVHMRHLVHLVHVLHLALAALLLRQCVEDHGAGEEEGECPAVLQECGRGECGVEGHADVAGLGRPAAAGAVHAQLVAAGLQAGEGEGAGGVGEGLVHHAVRLAGQREAHGGTGAGALHHARQAQCGAAEEEAGQRRLQEQGHGQGLPAEAQGGVGRCLVHPCLPGPGGGPQFECAAGVCRGACGGLCGAGGGVEAGGPEEYLAAAAVLHAALHARLPRLQEGQGRTRRRLGLHGRPAEAGGAGLQLHGREGRQPAECAVSTSGGHGAAVSQHLGAGHGRARHVSHAALGEAGVHGKGRQAHCTAVQAALLLAGLQAQALLLLLGEGHAEGAARDAGKAEASRCVGGGKCLRAALLLQAEGHVGEGSAQGEDGAGHVEACHGEGAAGLHGQGRSLHLHKGHAPSLGASGGPECVASRRHGAQAVCAASVCRGACSGRAAGRGQELHLHACRCVAAASLGRLQAALHGQACR